MRFNQIKNWTKMQVIPMHFCATIRTQMLRSSFSIKLIRGFQESPLGRSDPWVYHINCGGLRNHYSTHLIRHILHLAHYYIWELAMWNGDLAQTLGNKRQNIIQVCLRDEVNGNRSISSFTYTFRLAINGWHKVKPSLANFGLMLWRCKAPPCGRLDAGRHLHQ